MTEFIMPTFLENHSEDDVHERMRSILPEDLDLSEGGHAWNFTRPTALAVAEVCEFVLPEVIKLIFPEWSYGEFLDAHSKSRHITRREATAASGELTITGAANTAIPAGSLFSTASVNEEPSVDYETMESVTIPTEGTVNVTVKCTQAGIVGNTIANTIVLVSSGITGITAVTNEDPLTGGTEEEDDESLIARILEYDRSQNDSYVGSVADYKRWAMSVAGVGSATVIPASDDSGTVTIILTDSNGDPATDVLCQSVYNYIMKPDYPEERLAPPNAGLMVTPPSTMSIAISATVELEEDATVESVKLAFTSALAQYLPEAMEDLEIKYSRVWAVLSGTDGVNDFSNLQIGTKSGASITYVTGNIPVSSAQLPEISAGDIHITAGSVE